jgi:hypothetical protein
MYAIKEASINNTATTIASMGLFSKTPVRTAVSVIKTGIEDNTFESIG